MRPESLRKFGNSNSQPASSVPQNRMPRQPIPGPTSPSQFFSLLLFSILKKPVFVDVAFKAGIYMCVAAAGSLLFDFLQFPPSYFSNRRNVLNILFVKWGWAWTMSSLALFVVISTYIYTAGNRRLLRAHLMRLLFGSACWYVCTGIFNTVEASFGQCYDLKGSMMKPPTSRPFHRRSCRQANGHWLGFDISGHCFLLTMSNLYIMEELRVMKSWGILGSLLGANSQADEDDRGEFGPQQLPNVSRADFYLMRSSYQRLSGPLRLVFSFAASLSVLWDLMLLTTIVYFHSMPSKLIGTSIGVSCWFLGYRFLFPACEVGALIGLAPGMPGDGPLHFVPRLRR